MATVREELEGLKIRLGKKQGDARLTIVNHTDGTSAGMTVMEAFTLFRMKVEHDKGHEVVHIVDQAEEKKRKTNPNQGGSRIMLDCRSADARAKLRKQMERYFDIARDPRIAIDLITWALAAFSNKVIESKVREGYEQDPGTVQELEELRKAEETPAWLKD